MVAYSLFSPAVSAMQAQSRAFQNISDNVSNSQTPGYKSSEIRFQEMVGGKNAGNSFNSLLGTQAHQQVFREKEGTVVGSDRSLDAALSGEGFFLTSTSLTPSDRTFELTDAGRFDAALVDNAGTEEVYLKDMKGNFLLGWPFDTTTNTFTIDTNSTSSVSPIRIDQTGNIFEATATTAAELSINLPVTAATGDTFTFDIPIFDGTGDADGVNDTRQVITTFTKTAANNVWDLTISGTNGTVTTPAVQPVQVEFDANGALNLVGGAAAAPMNLSIDWTGPAVNTAFTLSLQGSTSFANEFAQIDLKTDGNTDGVLNSVGFGENGNVVGIFSNGLDRPLARIAVADVVSPDKLLSVGQTHYRLGPNSGGINLVDLNSTDRVFFSGSALELSTTDLGFEFTNMIITQRAYSSAATTLKTIDEMVRTASELK